MHSTLFLCGVQYSGRPSNPRAYMPEMTEGSKEHTHTHSGGPGPGITTNSIHGGYPLLSRSPSLSSKGCRVKTQDLQHVT